MKERATQNIFWRVIFLIAGNVLLFCGTDNGWLAWLWIIGFEGVLLATAYDIGKWKMIHDIISKSEQAQDIRRNCGNSD